MRKLLVVGLMLAFAPAAWGVDAVAINEVDYQNPSTNHTRGQAWTAGMWC